MWGRRIAYLMTLLGCLAFYGFYREWFSWLLLVAVGLLPLFSLVLSMPAMLTPGMQLHCPQTVALGAFIRPEWESRSRFPVSPVRCRIRVYNHLTGLQRTAGYGQQVCADHCGVLTVSCDRVAVCDYLGLFSRRLRIDEKCNVYVEPKPVPVIQPPYPKGSLVTAWKPKAGGGFSEDHDLRPYRPGDDLRNIHWKLVAKTGKLIYREPIEPVQNGYLLTMTLSGTPQQLDEKLGQLLYLSQALLNHKLTHTVRCVTADAEVCFEVCDAASWQQGLHRLLSSRVTKQETGPEEQDVLWHHHIGGDSHES